MIFHSRVRSTAIVSKSSVVHFSIGGIHVDFFLATIAFSTWGDPCRIKPPVHSSITHSRSTFWERLGRQKVCRKLVWSPWNSPYRSLIYPFYFTWIEIMSSRSIHGLYILDREEELWGSIVKICSKMEQEILVYRYEDRYLKRCLGRIWLGLLR